VRSTTKYWVRNEDVSAVKHHVLQYLPVFQFDKNNFRWGRCAAARLRCGAAALRRCSPAAWVMCSDGRVALEPLPSTPGSLAAWQLQLQLQLVSTSATLPVAPAALSRTHARPRPVAQRRRAADQLGLPRQLQL
jgi:hypothetical protein